VVALLDPRSARPVRAPLRIARPVSDLAYVRGGPGLAVARVDGVLELWDTRSARRRWSVAADADGLLAVAVSPDGRLVATGGLDGTLRFFDAGTGRRRGTPVPAHAGFTIATRFSPDGRVVATSGTDGVASLWDVRTGQRVGAPLPIGEGGAHAAYAPGGASLMAVTDTGRGALWDIDPAAWRRRACAVAGRVLTRDEWRAVLPTRPYRPACPPASRPARR
jgi:WD40 repeat protein